jgi:two-component system, cell cycle sensor histidine kinase and response regulator CckA
MKLRAHSITDISSVLTAVISLIIAVSIPTAYVFIAYRYMTGAVNTEIAFSARAVEGLIHNNPKSWQFEEIRIQEILQSRLDHTYRDNRIIGDLQGHVIAETREPLAWPVLTFGQFIYDSGIEAARIEFKRSIAPIVAWTAFIGVCSALLGMIIFLIFRFFPLRTVKEAYDKLRENEHRLVLALESGHFGVLDWDIKKNVVTWDGSMYEIYGISRDTVKISLEAWQTYIYWEDRKRFLEDISPDIIGERGYDTEFRIVKPDGTVRYIKADGIIVADEEGKPSRLISLNSDITERKRAEESLRASEERFESIVSTSQEWIWATDSSGIHTFSNPAVENILGYHPDEIIGRPVTNSLVHREDLPKKKELLDQCIKQKTGWPHTVFRWKHRDGTYRYLESGATPITDSTGVLHGFQGSDRDITERQQADDAIRKSEERYRTIFESTATANIIVAEDSTILMANNNFARLSGYTKQELEGKLSWKVFIHKDDLEKMNNYNRMRRLDPKSAPPSHEIRSINRKGEVLDLFVSAAVIPETKESIVSLIDLTERKQLEAQLIQAQKMQAIGTLAGGIAHDFNNILTVIMGFGTLLQMDMEKSDPLRKHVDQIVSSSHKAANLTRSLLAFSRKQPVTLAPISINNCIKGTEKLLKRLLTEDVELLVSLAPDDIIIMADATQIDQILFNLATNARDAMKKGGKLTMETKPFEMDGRFKELHGYGDPGTYALLTVSDTGCGMDESTIEKIFDPFFTTKELGKGTGLGLSTVYGIVKQHKGYIHVSSEPDKGTTFSVYLPAIETVVEEMETFSPATKGGNETILVAEDDTSVRFLMKETLANHGYTVIEAVDGQDAIEKFNRYRNIDLMILDSVMPGKNGREAHDEIRRIKPLTKTLFMSGYTRDVVLDKGVEDGKVDFIAKPILLDELLKKVREVLDK